MLFLPPRDSIRTQTKYNNYKYVQIIHRAHDTLPILNYYRHLGTFMSKKTPGGEDFKQKALITDLGCIILIFAMHQMYDVFLRYIVMKIQIPHNKHTKMQTIFI